MKKILLVVNFLMCAQYSMAQILLNEDIEVRLDSLIEETYEHNKPGGIVSIIKDNQILYKSHKGVSSLEHNIPISDSTIFDIGSLSKQFTAFTTLLLKEEGLLKLEDDISIYLPEFKNLPHKISIRNLLNHTHGLPNSHELAELCGMERMDHSQTINLLLRINSFNFIPGEKYEYNNTGYTLLSEIISRIENKPFQVVLKEKIFEPLKMKNTVVVDNPFQMVKNKAVSYGYAANEYSYLFNDKTSMGPGGICTNISDLSLWALNYASPKVGTTKMIAEMNKVTTLNSGSTVNYGFGIQSKKYKGVNVNFHGGADASYRSYMMHFPDYNVSIISLSNDGSFSALQLAQSMADILLNLKNDTIKDNVVSKREENSYEGTYEMFPGKYFNIISRNDSLFFQQFGYSFEIPLEYSHDQTYTIPMLPLYKIEFRKDEFDFHIVDSKFTCNKVTIDPPILNQIELNKFIGLYHNEEFDIIYRITVDNNKLVASSNYNTYITLFPLGKSSFYSSYQYFGKIEFIQNTNGNNNQFLLSGSLINDLVFKKINE